MRTNPSLTLRGHRARTWRRSRGVSLIWVAIALVVLIGFVALGIDMGRIKLAKTELQQAADAAARAACWPIPQLAFDEGMVRAQAVVDANDAGGEAIGYDVSQNDLEFGIWWRNTKTFEPLTGDLRVRANAVRVITHRDTERGNPLPMAFATAFNWDTTDIRAGAIAQIRGGPWAFGGGAGIFGIEWVQANGTTRTDSYNPLLGPYDPSTAGDGGGIGTNGWIEVIGTSDINGDARWGPDGDIDDGDYIEVWPEADVAGWQAPLDDDLVFPPVSVPDPYNNQPLIDAGLLETKGKWKNGIVVSGASEVTIPGGTPENPAVYYVSTLQLNSNTVVTIDGTVEFYVYGPVDLVGSITVLSGEGSWPLPSNLKINVIGDHDVEIGGGSALHAQIYAPESDVKIHGTGDEFGLFGGVIGKTVDILGNSAIHVDSSLQWPGQDEGPWVELVR